MRHQISHISVLGAGSWGTALAIMLCENAAGVHLWGRNREHINALIRDGYNARYLPGQRFPSNLLASGDIGKCISPSLNFFLAVPSDGFAETLLVLRQKIIGAGLNPEDATIIWGTKGFDPISQQLLSDVVGEVFGVCRCMGTLCGPSFARETAQGLPTALTLACDKASLATDIAGWFKTAYTRIYVSDDLPGVQLGGAIKNVLAIAAGISDGLGYGANARAALITRGLSELSRLGVVLGGRAETFCGLAGIGDLMLTCTDDQSRNRRFGMGLGQGRRKANVEQEIGQKIEGISASKTIFQISRRVQVCMPIAEQVYAIVHQGESPAKSVQALLNREQKAEI